MLTYFFLCAFICFVCYYVFSKPKHLYWETRKVAHVLQKSSFDTLWEFLVSKKSLPEIYKDVYDKFPGHPYVGIFSGSKPTLLVRDPEVIQQIFAGDFQSFHSRGIGLNTDVDVLADNLLFMDHFEKWKLLRQKISPIFTSARLKNMFYIIERSAKDFVRLVEKNRSSVKEPFELMAVFTAAAIGSAVFGIDTKSDVDTMRSPFVEMTKRTTSPSLRSTLVFFLSDACPRLYKMLKFKVFGEHEPFFLNFVRSVLRERRGETVKRHDFIDLCLELQNNGTMRDSATGYELEPSEEILAAQAFFFFLAGVDTSSNTMHFTLVELAKNRQILDKLHEQIDSVFEKSSGNPSYDDVDKLTYLDMIINESMRKYPNIGIIQRKCTRDTLLTVGNLKVDKDVLVVVPVYAIHRDSTYYSEPDKFDPERFAPGSDKNHHRYAYLPFGEGNRICIVSTSIVSVGARFARLQMKCGLIYLLREYTLAPSQPQKPLQFEPSLFSIRATKAGYSFVPRSLV
ncbi:hypothetical protein EVAR_41064_1 [Eumeta japonica]|uniref:unspecific monooxygenase n=1 Tax=Eumeta variegata TaxID=151549 RepID=A0A4C1XVJ6_EUMVA|nr:hypothetical protein EVAR_41064_1 [Eumeta japonica]